MIKIFHTSDNHLGINFNRYPEGVREKLRDRRLEALEGAVEMASENEADLFVVAGDLFDSLNVGKNTIISAARALAKFSGSLVLVLPGNHDYYTEGDKLWTIFKDNMSDHTILLTEEEVLDLRDYSVEALVYPAPCDSKHSRENKLTWLKEEDFSADILRIGIAHGALEGLSPDIEGEYFYMGRQELADIPMDLWLLGHTHVPYPLSGQAGLDKIFNAGTHEPDGINYPYPGTCFLIDLAEDGTIKSQSIRTGKYEFVKDSISVSSGKELEDALKAYTGISNKLIRLTISGYAEAETLDNLSDYYNHLYKEALFFDPRDGNLGLKFSAKDLGKNYVKDSLPYKFMEKLIQVGDPQAMQMAYELIEEAKK